MIRIEEISKRFGDVQALAEVSFEVHAGEVFGLLGANGSGKTTLARCVATLLQPDEGRITVAGHRVGTENDSVRATLGYLAEFPVVHPSLSGQEFLHFVGGLRGLPPREITERTERWLSLFELQSAARQTLSGYSQGMKRKVALAAALLDAPKVVLLDEPTNGLDPPSVYLVRQVIERLRAEGCAVLLSSHVLPFVQQTCDRIGVLASGRVKAIGTLEDLRVSAGRPEADLEELFLHFSGLDRVMLERLADAGLARSPGEELGSDP